MTEKDTPKKDDLELNEKDAADVKGGVHRPNVHKGPDVHKGVHKGPDVHKA